MYSRRTWITQLLFDPIIIILCLSSVMVWLSWESSRLPLRWLFWLGTNTLECGGYPLKHIPICVIDSIVSWFFDKHSPFLILVFVLWLFRIIAGSFKILMIFVDRNSMLILDKEERDGLPFGQLLYLFETTHQFILKIFIWLLIIYYLPIHFDMTGCLSIKVYKLSHCSLLLSGFRFCIFDRNCIIYVSVLNYLTACCSGSYPTNQILFKYCFILLKMFYVPYRWIPELNCLNIATAPSSLVYYIQY